MESLVGHLIAFFLGMIVMMLIYLGTRSNRK